MTYVVTIAVHVEADSEADACKAVGEDIRPLLQGGETAWIDCGFEYAIIDGVRP